MDVLKLVGCALLGVVAAFVGVVAAPDPVSAPWLGILLGVAIVAVGSMLSGELRGGHGQVLYTLVVFVCTVWLLGFTPSDDMLTLPAELAKDSTVDAWPLIVLVAALVPAYIADTHGEQNIDAMNADEVETRQV